MNCFDLMKKMVELDGEILELSNQLSKVDNISERDRISREIDSKLAVQLEIKHKLQSIDVVM